MLLYRSRHARHQHFQYPLRRDGKAVGAVDTPTITAAGRVHARRRQDVAAFPPHIDASRYSAGGIAHLHAIQPTEVEMPATPRDRFDSGRQCTVAISRFLTKFGIAGGEFV